MWKRLDDLLRNATKHEALNTFLIVLFLFDVIIGDSLSFSNVYIDRFFHYSWEFLFYLLIFFGLIILYLFFKNSIIKGILILIAGVDLLLVVVTFLIFLLFLMESDIDLKKYYFAERDGYKYYALTPRRSGLDDLKMNVFKEKKLYSLIKKRARVKEKEIIELGIDPVQLSDDYFYYYSRHSLPFTVGEDSSSVVRQRILDI